MPRSRISALSVRGGNVEVFLRPLLIELGATVPTGGLYVTEDEFADLDAVVKRWSAVATPIVCSLLAPEGA
jgi:FMN reductase